MSEALKKQMTARPRTGAQILSGVRSDIRTVMEADSEAEKRRALVEELRRRMNNMGLNGARG